MAYTWIFVSGCFASWFLGWGTGSNDVANAFGTSVGARTLTMGQAVVIAAIFEFVGAMVLGTVATSTLQGGIAELSAFQREPEIYAYGMLCAMTVAGAWQAVASYMELNTSTTHSVIGAILGFSLAYKGDQAVIWIKPNPTSVGFPYSGVVPIIVSWFLAPVATACVAGLIFIICRHTVLRAKNSYNRTFWALPPLVLLTVFACVFFVITKGAAKTLQDKNPKYKDQDELGAYAAWIAAVTGAAAAIVMAVAIPFMKKRADAWFASNENSDPENMKVALEVEKQEPVPWAQQTLFQKANTLIFNGVNQDIHKIVEEDPLVAAIHEKAEKFEPKTEYAFSYLQVFSAVCVIFAHGANDSAYMVGPLAGIYQVWRTGTLTKAQKPPLWIVVIGASGLVIGLATYGYNVTRAMGTRMAKLSPSRGFAAELATAISILLLSQYGLPNSSSQCITGAIVGVGLFGGLDFGTGRGFSWDTSGVNWKFFAMTFVSWVFTLVICGFGTAALFAQGVYSPSVQEGKIVMQYEDGVNAISGSILKFYNLTSKAVVDGDYVIPDDFRDIDTDYSSNWTALEKADKNYKKWYFSSKGNGTVHPVTTLGYLKKMLQLAQNSTVSVIGIDVGSLNQTANGSLRRYKFT